MQVIVPVRFSAPRLLAISGRLVFAASVIGACATGPVPAASGPSPAGSEVLPVEDYRDRIVPVAAWDSLSPQRVVRVDGELYQQRAGKLFKIVPEIVTVRLAEGVGAWSELVSQAVSRAPATYAGLRELTPRRANPLAILDLEIPEGSDPVAWCELLQSTGLVRYAELAAYGEYLAAQSDPMYPDQWGLNNTGQTGGTPGADIDAERAWDLTAGDPSIVVAVLDSGTDVDHEDLAGNVWHNDAEIPDNGLDDDGNGFVDDWEGWDFDHADNDPRSNFYHGTHVTGIVNAMGSNGVGIAGVAGGIGGPGVRGMALNVGQSSPNGAVIDDAILYAADNGAQVITLSLSIGETQAINDALAYAYNTKDVFIDCASGNSGSSVSYPATQPECMAVGATTHNDAASGFSNPGPEVEVAAPGSNILSTQPGNLYGSSDGTSFAAPAVAGLAALIRSLNPGLPAVDVRQLIIDTAEDVEDPGFDDKTGHGRINAYEAVALAANSNGTIRLDASSYACSSSIGLTVSDVDLAGAGSLSLAIVSEIEPAGESVTLLESGSGSGVFRGSIDSGTGAALTDGVLQVSHGDTVMSTYVDADDGAGGTNVVKTASAPIDCAAPAISGVTVHSLSNDSATIAWTTDENATSVVRHEESPPPTRTTSSPALNLQHDVTVGALAECTTYVFEVESGDSVGNAEVDDNGGAYYSFETYGTFAGIGVAECRPGQIDLDRTGSYGCSDTVGIGVVDTDLNADSSMAESAQVLVVSTSEPAGEWVSLTELSVQNSRFEGSIALDDAVGAVTGDGLLAIAPGDTIVATYVDEDDGTGNTRSVAASSSADCSAPVITGVQVTEISSTRAVVEWTTDEPATSRIQFGSTAGLGDVVEDRTLVTAHSLSISPFPACDRAYFRVESADEHGDLAAADADGQPFALNLWQIGGLVFHDNFENNSGWQLPGDWERGTPQGLGTPSGDPQGAFSGAYAIGNDLSGQGVFAGDYEPSSSESAVSPVINARGERNLELIVTRKLGVTSGDEAGIYVITSGTNQAWTSNYQANDDDWLQRTYDISAWADNKQSVQIEFRLESLDASHSFGWNIDEVIVKDATEPDLLTCGGCAGAPTFGGAAKAYDPDPCAPGGVIVEWEAGPAWGTGSGGTYDVYRGTTAGFVPDTSNRVASGLTGTSWTDSGAPAGTPVWYVVRSRNDESCTGGEGLDDGNLVRLPATETASLPLPDPVGDTLLSSRFGGAYVRLEWAPAAGAAEYVIYRGESLDFSDGLAVGTTEATFFEDLEETTGASYSYRVVAVDACGRQE